MGLKDFIKAANHSKEAVLKTIINSGGRTVNGPSNSNKSLHVSAAQKYPTAAALPLPINIDPAETTRFSPQRSRDISATAILSHQSNTNNIDITLDNSMISGQQMALAAKPNDPHVESYDCFGAVNLNSSMQSNVPNPFGGLHKFTHLNMPGGQWSQDSKFMSHNLHSSHYTNLRRETRASWSNYDQDATITQEKGIKMKQISEFNNSNIKNNYNFEKLANFSSLFNLHDNNRYNTISIKRLFSSSLSSNNQNQKNENVNKNEFNNEKLTKKDKLKKAFKEYGTTVIVFHVGISLVSLGMFYLLVSSGVDLVPLVEKIGMGSTSLSTKAATGAGTFVIAYAIHKVFAPVRISITLGATPFIVKYLRRKGFLKQTKT